MQERLERVPFPRPVHVSFLADGEGLGEQSVRVEAENLSHGGMFVRTEEQPELGSAVSVGLEARGKIFPFAEGEVVWFKEPLDARPPGFGVRFTKFLNPRSPELIEHIFDRALAVQQDVQAELAQAEPEVEPVEPVAPVEPAEPVEQARPKWSLLSQPIADLTPEEQEADEGPLSFGAQEAAPALEADWVPTAQHMTEVEDGPLRPSEVLDPRSRWFAAGAVLALLLVAALGGVLAAQWSVSKQQPEEGRQIIAAPPSPASAEASAEAFVEPPAPAPAPAPSVEVIPAPTPAAPPAPVVAAPVVPAAPPAPPAPAVRAPPPSQSGSARLPSGGAASVSWKQSGNAIEVSVALADGARIDRAFALSTPSRLVIDIDRVKPSGSAEVKGDGSLVRSVRVGQRENGTRLVLDLSRPASGAEMKGRTVRATLGR